MSEDDDDARLTNNTRTAMLMDTPELLKKPEAPPLNISKQKKKAVVVDIEEPLSNAQRLEQLHLQ